MRSKFALRGLLCGVLISGLLSGCGAFPRGAGLEREVLSHKDQTARVDGQKLVFPNFAIEPVTRSRLAEYATWPSVNEAGLTWIGRSDQPDSRVVAPGDSITVHIWSTEENGLLTNAGQRFVSLPPARISPGGSVFLPYVGSLRLAGMEIEHARSRVQQAYAEVTPSAQVQVELAKGRQSTVSLVGGVAKPGLYPLDNQDITVLELVAEGGGVAGALENPQIRLQRGSKLYGVSMDQLLDRPELNTTLRGGDKVFVEADKRYFLSLGATGKETRVYFPQNRVSALDALSLIGGLFDARANAKGILILRQYPTSALRADGTGPVNTRTIFTLDLTTADGLFSAGEFRMRPGDLIYATESPLGPVGTIIGLVGSVFGLANTATSVAARTQ